MSVLLTVGPVVPSKDWNKSRNIRAHGYIEEHIIEKGTQADSREPLLYSKLLKNALDPKFASLAPMLCEMGCQIAPEYTYLDEEPPKDHLHEVMRRLLLRYILQMEDPTELNPDVELAENQEEGQQ